MTQPYPVPTSLQNIVTTISLGVFYLNSGIPQISTELLLSPNLAQP